MGPLHTKFTYERKCSTAQGPFQYSTAVSDRLGKGNSGVPYSNSLLVGLRDLENKQNIMPGKSFPDSKISGS